MPDTKESSIEADNCALLDWFKSKGGSIHPHFGLKLFSGMGRGGVALRNIKKDTVLFALPRSLTLSIRTSTLPVKFGERAWKKYQLNKGWVGLILCMLWEEAQGEDSKWIGYLRSLPDNFNTPMFWGQEDLRELEGTSIFDKIGKAEAEEDYYNKLIPAVKSRLDLFPPDILDKYYSLERYHITGSRVLSRSFHVDKWNGEIEDQNGEDNLSDKNGAMEVDDSGLELPETVELSHETDEEDFDPGEEDPEDVAMVPLADALNAYYNSENAKLCYEMDDLQMISTRDIKEGDQIWNTYGDPPNSDLLRRYGHIDMVHMKDGSQGNPADIVEIRADLVVDIVRADTREGDELFADRIDWWLEEGGDDIFTIETNLKIPQSLISFIRLISANETDWLALQSKGKFPKPKVDLNVIRVAEMVLQKRFELYKTSIEEDEALIKKGPEGIGYRQHMAIVVRLGEKKILQGSLRELADYEEIKEKKKKRSGEKERDDILNKRSRK